MTSGTQLRRDCMNKKSRFEKIVTSYGNRNLDEIEKRSRTSPDPQFKEFSFTIIITNLEWTMNVLKMPILTKDNLKNHSR